MSDLRAVRTTLQPEVELEVTDRERENLRALGVLIEPELAAPAGDEPSPASRRPRTATAS